MNLEKFKSMSFRQKLEWIIHYYGIWIIVALIFIGVSASFLHSVLFPEPIKDTVVIILSDDFNSDEVPKMEEDLAQITGGTVSVTVYNLSDVYGNGAFSIKLTSDQIDLVLSPEEEKNQMVESEYLESFQKLDYGDLYLGIPANARKGEKLDKAVEYFKEGIKK